MKVLAAGSMWDLCMEKGSGDLEQFQKVHRLISDQLFSSFVSAPPSFLLLLLPMDLPGGECGQVAGLHPQAQACAFTLRSFLLGHPAALENGEFELRRVTRDWPTLSKLLKNRKERVEMSARSQRGCGIAPRAAGRLGHCPLPLCCWGGCSGGTSGDWV